jgi:hypothetical protein
MIYFYKFGYLLVKKKIGYLAWECCNTPNQEVDLVDEESSLLPELKEEERDENGLWYLENNGAVNHICRCKKKLVPE